MKAKRHRVPPVVRVLLLTRARNRCELCGQKVEPGRWDPHHRKQTSVGGDDQLFNLLAVCRPCHDRVHADIGRGRVHGWLADSWADPLEVAVDLFDGRYILDGLGGMERVD